MYQVSATNYCYFVVNEFSTAAYWSFLPYNIRNRSTLLCYLLSLIPGVSVYTNSKLILNNYCYSISILSEIYI